MYSTCGVDGGAAEGNPHCFAVHVTQGSERAKIYDGDHEYSVLLSKLIEAEVTAMDRISACLKCVPSASASDARGSAPCSI